MFCCASSGIFGFFWWWAAKKSFEFLDAQRVKVSKLLDCSMLGVINFFKKSFDSRL